MKLLLLWLLVQAQFHGSSPRVDGLRAGERAVHLAPLVLSSEARSLERGRVVSAATGVPIAGAKIEAWVEGHGPGRAGPMPIGETRSGPDGAFQVAWADGALQADKLRVSASSHLTFAGTRGDIELVRLMPAPPRPLVIRVADLHDRPISGARIRSTYSCAHDIPAFDAETDALGEVTLWEYGLQGHRGDLRVQAPGYGAIKYVSPTRTLALARGEPVTLRLARRAGFQARILARASGAPLVGVPIEIRDEPGHHLTRTDDDGIVAVSAPYDGDDPMLFVVDEPRNLLAYSGRLPSRAVVNLCVDSENLPEVETSRLTIVGRLGPVARALAAAEPVGVRVFHERGWTATKEWGGASVSLDLPEGEVLVHVGGTFSGWEERTVAGTLERGAESNVEVEFRPEPRAHVRLPENARGIIVQAGADSIELEGARGDVELPVPRVAELIVLSLGGDQRRVVLNTERGERFEVDLANGEVWPPTRSGTPREGACAALVRVVDDGGEPVAGAAVEGWPDVEGRSEVAPGVFRLAWNGVGPRLLSARASGCARISRMIEPSGRDVLELELRMPRLASLRVESRSGRAVEVVGPERDLAQLHPGPTRLEVRYSDGERLGLSLELASGEARTLFVD